MTAPKKMAKRAAAGTLALAVCLTGGVIGAGAASAAPGFKFDQRISGPDRTATAIAASKFAFDDGSSTVIIVERDAVVDGLTASYAAGLNKAPILYVDRQGVPDNVAAEIKRLGATKALLVGGTAVLPQAVVTQLESAGLNVTRQSGPDRYATAAVVAKSGSNMPDKVLVASGETPADALAAGPVAYAKNYPLVLVRADSVPASSRDALDSLGSGERLAIGGTVRISAGVYDSLGQSKRRISGANRQLTAIEIAKLATGELGFQKDRVALVSNSDRAAVDALVASPVAGKNLAPLLFTNGNNIGDDTAKYLQDNAADLTGPGYIFGGTAAVPQSAADQGTTAAGGEDAPSSIGFNITPNDDQTLVFAANVDTDTTDDRAYAVSGLDNDLTYRVTLVNADNVRIAADGKVTFKARVDAASASGFSVDPGAPTTDISVVNGSPLAINVGSTTAKPVSGNLSFTIDGDGAESVYPVVYVNGGPGKNADQGGPSPFLESQATKAGDFAETAEKYGLGGKTTYIPAEAATGRIGAADQPILSVDKNAQNIVTAAASYKFDDNDNFYIIAGEPAATPVETETSEADRVTFDEFKTAVSALDHLDGYTFYQRQPGLPSTFVLENLSPAAPTLTVGTPKATSIPITVTNYVEGASIEVFIAKETNDPDAADQRPDFTTATEASFTKVATITAANDENTALAGLQYSVPVTGTNGAVDYSVAVRQLANGETSTAAEQNDVSVPAITETVAPTITSTFVSTDAAPSGILIAADGTSTDVVDFNFSESMVATLGDTNATFFRVSDGTNTFQVANNGTAPWVLDDDENDGADTNNTANDHLTADFANATITRIAGTGALDLASGTLTVTLVSNAWDDAAGNQLDLAGSADKVINLEN